MSYWNLQEWNVHEQVIWFASWSSQNSDDLSCRANLKPKELWNNFLLGNSFHLRFEKLLQIQRKFGSNKVASSKWAEGAQTSKSIFMWNEQVEEESPIWRWIKTLWFRHYGGAKKFERKKILTALKKLRRNSDWKLKEFWLCWLRRNSMEKLAPLKSLEKGCLALFSRENSRTCQHEYNRTRFKFIHWSYTSNPFG